MTHTQGGRAVRAGRPALRRLVCYELCHGRPDWAGAGAAGAVSVHRPVNGHSGSVVTKHDRQAIPTRIGTRGGSVCSLSAERRVTWWWWRSGSRHFVTLQFMPGPRSRRASREHRIGSEDVPRRPLSRLSAVKLAGRHRWSSFLPRPSARAGLTLLKERGLRREIKEIPSVRACTLWWVWARGEPRAIIRPGNRPPEQKDLIRRKYASGGRPTVRIA